MSMDYQLAMPPLRVQLMLPPHIACARDMDNLEYALINPPPGYDMVPRLCPIQSEAQRPNVCAPYMLPYPLRLIVINHRLAAYYLNELGQICLVAQLLDSSSAIEQLSGVPPADIPRTELIYSYYHFDGAGHVVQTTLSGPGDECLSGHCIHDELGLHCESLDNLHRHNLCSCQHFGNSSSSYRYGSHVHSVHDGIDVFNTSHNCPNFEQIVEIDFGVNDVLYEMEEESLLSDEFNKSNSTTTDSSSASSRCSPPRRKYFANDAQKKAEKVPADGPTAAFTENHTKAGGAVPNLVPLKYRTKAGYIVEEPDEKLGSAKRENVSAKA